eukprot:11983286-Alexandrium_andersonii.AAC.1
MCIRDSLSGGEILAARGTAHRLPATLASHPRRVGPPAERCGAPEGGHTGCPFRLSPTDHCGVA